MMSQLVSVSIFNVFNMSTRKWTGSPVELASHSSVQDLIRCSCEGALISALEHPAHSVMACPHHVSAPWNPRALWYAYRAGGVRAATGKLREQGHGGHSRLALVSGFLWSCARPLCSCFILAPVLDPSWFSKRLVKKDTPYCHQSKALQN